MFLVLCSYGSMHIHAYALLWVIFGGIYVVVDVKEVVVLLRKVDKVVLGVARHSIENLTM